MTDGDLPPAPDLDDAERAAVLRDVAEDVRDGSSEADQVAALLYRASDVLAPGEETTPTDVYLNMRYILSVKEDLSEERLDDAPDDIDA